MFTVMIARQERNCNKPVMQRRGRLFKTLDSAKKSLIDSPYKGWVFELTGKGKTVEFVKGFNEVVSGLNIPHS